MTTDTFDTTWEGRYADGLDVRYPYDHVVTFVNRHHPRNRPRSSVNVLEVGCGSGNNLWFAAREGFSVFGIDGSASAIDRARKRLADDHLTGSLHVGDFTHELPLEPASVDLAIDRLAITHSSRLGGEQAIAQIHRVLKPGGHFLFNCFSDVDSSYAGGRRTRDGVVVDIEQGSLSGYPQVTFYGRQDIDMMFQEGWTIVSLLHAESAERQSAAIEISAEWRVVAVRR